MAVQFPQRTIADQTAAYLSYAANTLYPYTFISGNLVLGTAFTKTQPASLGSYPYVTFAFQADNNLAIQAIHISVVSTITSASLGATTLFNFIEISYSPIPYGVLGSGAAVVNAVPTIPTDSGNVIFNGIWVFTPTQLNPILDYYQRYEPNNYIMKYNQFLYIHIGTQAAQSGSAVGSIFANTTLHTLPTGLKV